MSDIWVRYNKLPEDGDYSHFNDEHISTWYPAYYVLTSIKRITDELMILVDGERLGGVLITKLPPGGRIDPHTDSGWHASYYDKFFVGCGVFSIRLSRGRTFSST